MSKLFNMDTNSYTSKGINVNQIETVADLLMLIENNPKTYLGGVNGSGTYAALVAYLTALEYSSFFDQTDICLKGFKEWFYRQHSIEPSKSIYTWLEEEYSDNAFFEFFKAFNRYRTSREDTC